MILIYNTTQHNTAQHAAEDHNKKGAIFLPVKPLLNVSVLTPESGSLCLGLGQVILLVGAYERRNFSTEENELDLLLLSEVL